MRTVVLAILLLATPAHAYDVSMSRAQLRAMTHEWCVRYCSMRPHTCLPCGRARRR